MKTNKKQIKDLELWEVDYLVAGLEGLEAKIKDNRCLVKDSISFYSYSPTTNPSQAWPIIEKTEIRLMCEDNKKWWAEIRLFNDGKIAFNTSYDKAIVAIGKTPLEAAMRCYVASKFGDEMSL